jgi:hypothetical protein
MINLVFICSNNYIMYNTNTVCNILSKALGISHKFNVS